MFDNKHYVKQILRFYWYSKHPKGGDTMTLKQKIFSFLAVVTLVLTPINAVAPAYAADNNTTTQQNFFTGLVQFIAQKFGLDKTQVQSAVNDYHAQHKQQVQQKLQANEKNHLDSLVSQGKITSSQEQQILDEQQKLQSEYNPANFKNLTPDQRRQQFEKEQAEIQAWSKETGIDAKYLRPGFMHFGRMRMFNKWNNNNSPKITPTPSI